MRPCIVPRKGERQQSCESAAGEDESGRDECDDAGDDVSPRADLAGGKFLGHVLDDDQTPR